MYFLPFIWRISALHGSFSVLVTWQTWSVFAFCAENEKAPTFPTCISMNEKCWKSWEFLALFKSLSPFPTLFYWERTHMSLLSDWTLLSHCTGAEEGGWQCCSLSVVSMWVSCHAAALRSRISSGPFVKCNVSYLGNQIYQRTSLVFIRTTAYLWGNEISAITVLKDGWSEYHPQMGFMIH